MTDNKIKFEPGAPEFGGPAGTKKSRYITPESTRGEENRWQYTITGVRAYEPFDLEEFIGLYKRAFAESPWNESWSDGQVMERLGFIQSQKNPLLLVADNCFFFQGLACGYQLPAEEYKSLEGQVSPEACYISDLLVESRFRKKWIGTDLGMALENEAYKIGMPELVVKIGQGNTAAMALFKSLGYAPLDILAKQDTPESSRISPGQLYLAKVAEIRELYEP